MANTTDCIRARRGHLGICAQHPNALLRCRGRHWKRLSARLNLAPYLDHPAVVSIFAQHLHHISWITDMHDVDVTESRVYTLSRSVNLVARPQTRGFMMDCSRRLRSSCTKRTRPSRRALRGHLEAFSSRCRGYYKTSSLPFPITIIAIVGVFVVNGRYSPGCPCNPADPDDRPLCGFLSGSEHAGSSLNRVVVCRRSNGRA
ncbi:hypothetical protein PLICRDRAFT_187271 [Plicaturopsis crispa FD-325 SS-3]|nr:hypothetical protein PLICRDRAFT_187271 [Plicaturopsis crispa FD-325 SS-3]